VSGPRAVHLYVAAGPLCGAVTSCEALYAVDDQGRAVPEAVTCLRCLAAMNPPESSVDSPGHAAGHP
jgi:hypothetical protein